MKKIFLNCIIINKKILLAWLVSQTFFLQAPPRVEILKRSASEETGRRHRPTQLTIDISDIKIEDTARSARFDDSARTQRVWEILKIINTDNHLPPFRYDDVRDFFTSSPVRSPLSPDELEQIGNVIFPKSIDAYLNNHALVLNFENGRKNMYLPGLAKENDGLCTFGCFEYRLAQHITGVSLPENICDYRKFNPIEAERFHFDDTLLQTFDAKNPLRGPGGWGSPSVKKVFNDLAEIQQLLETEQSHLIDQHESTFPTCFLSNLRTLLVGQGRIAMAQAPFDTQEIGQKLQSYQAQINGSKHAIRGSVESLHDLDTTQEIRDQVRIIDANRKLQVTTLLAGWEQLRNIS